MSDSTQAKISKLYQILSGKIPNKRNDYPLFDWNTLLDFFLAFYDYFCDPSMNHKEKAIGMFNKLYAGNVKELKNLRISKSDFDLLKTIGKGHFGEVVVVKEKNTSNVYAMKVLKKAATLSQDNMAFFFEERDIMAFANSEWVTTLHYAFQDFENLYLVMEFLPGGDLLSLLNRYDDCIVDEDTCRFYLSEIIIATNCIHKIGYVHRDIKPENVLLDITGHIKLADFGSAAKLVNGTQVFGKMPVGTPEYIAPEVLTSMDSGGGRYGIACDYWSIGVVAYEMLFGMLPFEADSVLQLYNQIMNFAKNLEFPDDVVLTPETENLIRGLICDQNNRYTYSTLAQHNFFSSLDWTTIKNMPPPYVPVVTSKTDTSNFDDINTSSAVVNKSATTSSKNFSPANTLPFIGFSFTRSLQQQLQDDISKTIGISNRRTSITGNNTIDDSSMISTMLSVDKSATDIMITEYKSLTTELENVKKELEKTKKDLSTSQNDITKIETDKNYYISEVEKIKGRYKELSQKYDQTIQHNNQIDSQGTKLVSELLSIFDDYYDSTCEDQTNLVSNIKNKYTQLKEDKIKAEKQTEDLTSEVSSLNYKIESLTNHIKVNDTRYIASTAELKETVTSLQHMLEKSEKESKDTISKLKQAAIDDDNRIKQLSNELEQSKSFDKQNQDPKLLGVLQSDLNTANTSVSILTNENVKLSEKLADSEEHVKKLKSQIKKLENRIDNVTNDFKSVEFDSIKLKGIISDKNLFISNLNENISTLERAKVEIVCQLEITTSKLRTKEALQSELESKISELKIEAEKLKNKDFGDLKLLTSELRAANSKITSLSEELEDKHSSELFIMTSLRNAQAEISDLSKNVTELESINTTLESDIKLLKETIQAQKVSNYSLTELIEKLKDDLAASNSETQKISNEYIEFKSIKNEEEFRLTETLKQQEKLIEFLQSMNVGKKKSYKSDSKDESQNVVDPTSRNRKEKLSRVMRTKSTKSKDKLRDYDRELDPIHKMLTIAVSPSSKDHPNALNQTKSSYLQSENTSTQERITTTVTDNSAVSTTSSSRRQTTRNSGGSILVSQSEQHVNIVSESKIINRNSSEIAQTIKNEPYVVNSITPSPQHVSHNDSISDVALYSQSQHTPVKQQGSIEILLDELSKHQLVDRLNLFKNVCMVCFNVIKFGLNFSMCKICCLKCHPECAEFIFIKCDNLSYEWFSFIPTIRFCSKYFINEKNYSVPVTGWVNILTKVIKTKTEWEQRWMVALNNMLMFYKHPKTMNEISDGYANDPDLIELYNFSPGEFIVKVNICTSDALTYAGTTDSRNYWSIEVPSKYNTIARKRKSVSASLFFSSSPEDKIYWVSMLSYLFHQYSVDNKLIQHNSQNVQYIEEINIEKKSNICFSFNLNNDVSLVATTNELYIFNNNAINKGNYFVKLQGFNHISGISKIKDNIFIICGKSRMLVKVESKIIMNELKVKVPTIFDTTKFIFSGLYKQCHLLCSGKSHGETYLCIAIGARFVVFKPSNPTPVIDITYGSFIENIHFTSIGILYGTDVVRIFNVKSGDSKSFLDQNDSSLAVQIFGQKSSYNNLLNVITLKSKKNNEEFLLCYSELGVIVNKEGLRSRMIDLIWSGVPTGFQMVRKNLLLVCYFDRIDAYDLSETSLNSSQINIKISYSILSPTIIHQASTYIIVSGTDPNGIFGIYKLDLP